jgi:glutamate---cysteine ligase / carboxylate-amine ligase
VQTILDRGTGADRQLKVFSDTNDLRKVVAYTVAETEAGL